MPLRVRLFYGKSSFLDEHLVKKSQAIVPFSTLPQPPKANGTKFASANWKLYHQCLTKWIRFPSGDNNN